MVQSIPPITGNVLLTLVHLSDLHIGQLDPQGRTEVPDAIVQQWWGKNKELYGFLGHTYEAMAQLEEFVADLAERENTSLIVTGDFTTCGAKAEFETAEAYLSSEADMGPNRCIGLRVDDVLKRSIPGNHDHWPGLRTVLGPCTAHLKRVFPELPLAPTVLELGSNRRVILFGINTDHDVHPLGLSRFWARGRFATQLDALDSQIAGFEHRDGDIRVLLMHHSRMHKKRGAIVEKTQDRLNATIEAGRISVLLSGHVHSPAFHIQRIAAADVNWELVEARCGTTLQRDHIPDEWIAAGFAPATLEPNNVLVHRIVDIDGTRLEWRTTPHSRTSRGFSERAPLSGSRPVTIWQKSRKRRSSVSAGRRVK